jgi:hypothetical protein
MSEVLRSAARQDVSHLAVSWDEEMVFRGYGFETVREVLGQDKALVDACRLSLGLKCAPDRDLWRIPLRTIHPPTPRPRPYALDGRSGQPEPGLLSTLIHLVMALLVWLSMRHSSASLLL